MHDGPTKRFWEFLAHLVLVPSAVILALCVVGCIPNYRVPVLYYSGDYGELVKYESMKAERSRKDFALHQLHIASAAMAAGDVDRARSAFEEACEVLLSFSPEGEWKAVHIEERAKEFRGDPYEQMFAFFLRGLLEYAENDLEDAQASFKTALLADTGTSEERYRSDSAICWLMLGKALQRLGEVDSAEDCFRRAARVPWFKWSVATVGGGFNAGAGTVGARYGLKNNEGQLKKELGLASKLLIDAIWLAASNWNTPTDVFRRCRLQAIKRLWAIAGSADKEDRQLIRNLDPLRVEAWLEAVCDEAFEGHVSPTDTALARHVRAREEAFINERSLAGNNLTVIAYAGPGPVKHAVGKYKHILTYRRNAVPVERCTVQLVAEGGRLGLVCQQLADVGFQAITRGGREIDAILKKKAVYKDTMISTGTVGVMAAGAAVSVGAAAMMSTAATTTTVATATAGTAAAGTSATTTAVASTMVFPPVAIAVAGGALAIAGTAYLIAALTNPAADTRCWEAMPGAFYVASARVAPGQYDIEVSCHPDRIILSNDLVLPTAECRRRLKQAKDDESRVPNLVHYGATAPDVMVYPDQETIVLINAGPFLPAYQGQSTPIVGSVALNGGSEPFTETGREIARNRRLETFNGAHDVPTPTDTAVCQRAVSRRRMLGD